MNKEVTVNVAGQELRLKFTTWAFYQIEDEIGVNFLREFPVGENLSIRSLVALTWGALLHQNKRLTLEATANLLDFGKFGEGEFEELVKSLLLAWVSFQGKDPKEVEKKMEEATKKEAA